MAISDEKFQAGKSSRRRFCATADGPAEVTDGAPHDETDAPGPSRDGLAAMSFAAHVMSLNTLGLMQLGAVPDDTGQVEPSREGGRQIIDTLEMLRDKTRGNLTSPESRLLESVLTDLRLHYVRCLRDRTA